MGRVFSEEDLDEKVSLQAGGILAGLDDEVDGSQTEIGIMTNNFYRRSMEPKPVLLEPKPVLLEHEAAAIRKAGKIKAIVNRVRRKNPDLRNYDDRRYVLYFIRHPTAQPLNLWNEIKEAYGKKSKPYR